MNLSFLNVEHVIEQFVGQVACLELFIDGNLVVFALVADSLHRAHDHSSSSTKYLSYVPLLQRLDNLVHHYLSFGDLQTFLLLSKADK